MRKESADFRSTGIAPLVSKGKWLKRYETDRGKKEKRDLRKFETRLEGQKVTIKEIKLGAEALVS